MEIWKNWHIIKGVVLVSLHVVMKQKSGIHLNKAYPAHNAKNELVFTKNQLLKLALLTYYPIFNGLKMEFRQKMAKSISNI